MEYAFAMVNSREKGKRGELQAAEALGRLGLDCRRSAQYCGKAGDADLVCDGVNLHFEVKLVERLNPYRFIDQAVTDSRASGKTPVVVMRSSHRPWLVCLRLDDVAPFIREIIRENADLRSELAREAVRAQGLPREPMADLA